MNYEYEYKKTKEFWINKIEDLKNDHGIPDEQLQEGVNWKDELNNKLTFIALESCAERICRDIHDKLNQPLSINLLSNEEVVEYRQAIEEDINQLEMDLIDSSESWKLYEKLLEILGYQPTNDDLDENDAWQDLRTFLNGISITELIGKVGNAQTHLGVRELDELSTEQKYRIPTGANLEGLIKWWKELIKVVNKNLDIFDRDATNKIVRINESKIDAYQASLAKLFRLKTDLEILDSAGNIDNNRVNQLKLLDKAAKSLFGNSLPDLPTLIVELVRLENQRKEYNRIYIKLSGKVSDSDLDAFVNHACPTCPHADYDNIKTEKNHYKNNLNLILGTTNLPNDWTTKLAKKSDLETETQRANSETTRADTNQTLITNTQTALGITDLNHLPTMPVGKSVADLITFFDNPPAPNCSHSDYDTIKRERDTLKGERDQLQTENAELKADSDTQLANKEKTILEKLITDCNLGLDKSSNLEQVISKIKDLTKSPGSPTENDSEIEELKQENEQLLAQLQKKEAIIKNYQKPVTKMPEVTMKTIKAETIRCGENWWNINSEVKQNLQQAETFEKMLRVENEFFKEKLGEEVNKTKNEVYLNIGLGVVMVGSLGMLVRLIVKQKKLLKTREKRKGSL